MLDPLRAYAEAALEGDDVAVAALVRATQPAVWRLCAALGSDDNVDDLVQDTFLRALKSLDASNGIESSRKQPMTLCLRPLERRRLPASRSWLRILRRRSRDDDDDPPPCPAYAVIPPRQGAGGAVACPEPVAA